MYLASLDYLFEKADIPQTISISYDSRKYYVPQEYSRALCTLFAQLGPVAPASSFLQATTASARTARMTRGNVWFILEFPASCSYLTAIGGTTGYDPKVSTPLSGGGFLDHFPRPALPGRCRVRIPLSPRHQVCWPLQMRSLLSHDATVSHFVINAALRVVASLTLPRRRPSSQIPIPRQKRSRGCRWHDLLNSHVRRHNLPAE
ncbi:hypothetical protein EDB84DRAFT_301515 [Lactarius hengduanensis]|nr:hypothetical protein EDB84DRAFT_301515 [Lactarius hengduanensis]